MYAQAIDMFQNICGIIPYYFFMTLTKDFMAQFIYLFICNLKFINGLTNYVICIKAKSKKGFSLFDMFYSILYFMTLTKGLMLNM